MEDLSREYFERNFFLLRGLASVFLSFGTKFATISIKSTATH